MPWLRSSASKVQTNVFCCCLIVNYGVALHRTCYTIVCIFGPGIFGGFAGSPRDFFCVLTFGSIRSSPSLEIPSTPPGATTTPFSVGIESFCLKYFSDTKFVYRKIVELLVFAWTNIVTHLLQEFAFSQNLNVLMIFNFWSASHVYCTSWET